MRRKGTRLLGFSMIEMLIAMSIVIVLSGLGAGAFIGFRETTLVRENISILKQDIQLVQQKAMFLETGGEENWIYGIGIDFTDIESGTYKYFRWCSPFSDFGSEATKSMVLGMVPDVKIGDTVTNVKGVSDTLALDLYSCPKGCKACHYEDFCYDYDFCCVCNYLYTSEYCNPSDKCCIEKATPPPPPPPDDPIVSEEFVVQPFKSGILPTDTGLQSSCTPGVTSLVEITGDINKKFLDMGNISLLGDVRYVVFEALTGRAFLYNEEGYPINFDSMGNYIQDSPVVLDILIGRARSSKFDILSVYPLSGVVIHHVYSDKDKALADEKDTIVVNGKTYSRYNIFDEISSYRDY